MELSIEKKILSRLESIELKLDTIARGHPQKTKAGRDIKNEVARLKLQGIDPDEEMKRRSRQFSRQNKRGKK